MSYMAMDPRGAQAAWALGLALGAFMCGVLATLAWGCIKLVGIRRELEENWEWKRKPKSEVQIIEESPPPTRNSKLMSSESHRRMAQSFRARRRGGKRRFGAHRRSMTRTFNPISENDCGFACLVKASGHVPTKKNIEKVRYIASQRVKEAFLADMKVHGESVRDMVASTGHNLASYVASLQWDMWASPIDLCLAARDMNLSIAIATSANIIKEGGRASHVVKLEKQHYTLHALHRDRTVSTAMPKGRGGMRPTPWTWETADTPVVSISSRPEPSPPDDDIPDWAKPPSLSPTIVEEDVDDHIDEPPRVFSVKVYVSPNVRTDIMHVQLVLREGTTVAALRARLSTMLGIVPERVRILTESNETLLLSTVVPHVVHVQDNWDRQTLAYDYMEIHEEGNNDGPKFIMRVNQLWTHGQLLSAISEVVNRHPTSIVLTDLMGNR